MKAPNFCQESTETKRHTMTSSVTRKDKSWKTPWTINRH